VAKKRDFQMKKYKYIYAILDSNVNSSNHKPDIMGLDNSSVYFVGFRDISAAVSNVNWDKIKVSSDIAFSYEKTIENLWVKYNLLPMRFGSVMKNDTNIVEILKRNYSDFVDNLKKVENKSEFGLKILWDMNKTDFKPEYTFNLDNYKKLKQLNKNSIYRNYLIDKLKQHKSEDSFMKKIDDIIEEIHSPLKKLSYLYKVKKMVTPKIILNATYLVKNDMKDEFIQTIKQIKREKKDIKFLLTGPWPPYNFVNKSIK